MDSSQSSPLAALAHDDGEIVQDSVPGAASSACRCLLFIDHAGNFVGYETSWSAEYLETYIRQRPMMYPAAMSILDDITLKKPFVEEMLFTRARATEGAAPTEATEPAQRSEGEDGIATLDPVCPVEVAIRGWRLCKNRPDEQVLVDTYGSAILARRVFGVVRDGLPWIWLMTNSPTHSSSLSVGTRLERGDVDLDELTRRILLTDTIHGRAAIELFLCTGLRVDTLAFSPPEEDDRAAIEHTYFRFRETLANDAAVYWRGRRDRYHENHGMRISYHIGRFLSIEPVTQRDASKPAVKDSKSGARREREAILRSPLPLEEYLGCIETRWSVVPSYEHPIRNFRLVESALYQSFTSPQLTEVEKRMQRATPGSRLIVTGNENANVTIYACSSEEGRIVYFGQTQESLSERAQRDRQCYTDFTKGKKSSKFVRIFNVLRYDDYTHTEIRRESLEIATKKEIDDVIEDLKRTHMPEGWYCANDISEYAEQGPPDKRLYKIYRIIEILPPGSSQTPRCYIGSTGLSDVERRIQHHRRAATASFAIIPKDPRVPIKYEILCEMEMTEPEAKLMENAYIHQYRSTALNKADPRLEHRGTLPDDVRREILIQRDAERGRKRPLAPEPGASEEEDKAPDGKRYRSRTIDYPPGFAHLSLCSVATASAGAAGAGAGSASDAAEGSGRAFPIPEEPFVVSPEHARQFSDALGLPPIAKFALHQTMYLYLTYNSRGEFYLNANKNTLDVFSRYQLNRGRQTIRSPTLLAFLKEGRSDLKFALLDIWQKETPREYCCLRFHLVTQDLTRLGFTSVSGHLLDMNYPPDAKKDSAVFRNRWTRYFEQEMIQANILKYHRENPDSSTVYNQRRREQKPEAVRADVMARQGKIWMDTNRSHPCMVCGDFSAYRRIPEKAEAE